MVPDECYWLLTNLKSSLPLPQNHIVAHLLGPFLLPWGTLPFRSWSLCGRISIARLLPLIESWDPDLSLPKRMWSGWLGKSCWKALLFPRDSLVWNLNRVWWNVF